MTDATFWDGIAEKYAAQPVADPDAFERKIAITLDRIGHDSIVLDVGCGTGSLALRLAPSAGRVHGLDVSGEMIRIARSKADAAGAGNVTFHVGAFDDGFDALPDGGVDVLCAYSILHLVDDRPAALDRMFRLLRPGGALVSSTVCLGGSWVPYPLILRVMRLFGKAPRVSCIDADRVEADVRAAGFVDVERPDVGAKKEIAFLTARKPSADAAA